MHEIGGTNFWDTLYLTFSPSHKHVTVSAQLHTCRLYKLARETTVRPRPHVSGDFCIRQFFYADTPSVHTCPPYTLGVSGDFCIRSPEWKFLYTLCIQIRVDARIRIFFIRWRHSITTSLNAHALLTNPLRCPDTNRIRVDGRIRFVYATCGRRYFCIRIKKICGYKNLRIRVDGA